ncbi:MAG TPA: radical SAM protein, partial [Methanococcaceae archaeon]|nr:radical SAM protein [Methanococcaceae archaeon]
PNKFKGGISCLAMHVLYCHLNKYSDVRCDMYFLENYSQIKNKDAIVITLQYENDYFNVVRIVEELRSKNPEAIFIGGGPCSMANPLPLSDFFDVFVIGEIEGTDVMYRLINREIDVEGAYFPEYHGKSREAFKSIKRIYPKKLTIEDYPIRQFTHPSGAYGKAYLLEIGRGCPRRCKFCMARCIYYPPRFRRLEDLIYLVDEGLKYTDGEKIALIAPSVGDYRHIVELCEYIRDRYHIPVSPSSLRADTISEELLEVLDIKTLTIAPEAGSERLREYIGKDISKEDIERALEIGKRRGIEGVKLYFMVGLPTEEWEDIEEIVNLSKDIKRKFKRVAVSVNPFIPKPCTEFEKEPFNIESKRAIKYIEKSLRRYGIQVSYENFNSMVVQCVLARGDASLGSLLKEYKKPNQLLKYLKKKGLLDRYLGTLK